MQSKTESVIEVSLNMAAGMLVSWLSVYFLFPLWGIEYSASQAAEITVFFTIISFTRSYLWRRYFNKRLIKRLAELV